MRSQIWQTAKKLKPFVVFQTHTFGDFGAMIKQMCQTFSSQLTLNERYKQKNKTKILCSSLSEEFSVANELLYDRSIQPVSQ